MKKAERHHWWPKCASKEWVGHDGGVSWMLPSGEIRRTRPSNLGVIKDGHFIKLSKDPGEMTPWDQNFEEIYQSADNNFPNALSWIKSLRYENLSGFPLEERFVAQMEDHLFCNITVRFLVALAVRSPMTRAACVRIAEEIRGPLPERERNALIALNMRDIYSNGISSVGDRGKLVIIYSQKQEFIFGDGFYHNIVSANTPIHSPRILAPLTPNYAVLLVRPRQYLEKPKITTLMLDEDETNALNDTVQIYSSNAIFFREQMPKIIREYKKGTHFIYSDLNNVVDRIIQSIPGVVK